MLTVVKRIKRCNDMTPVDASKAFFTSDTTISGMWSTLANAHVYASEHIAASDWEGELATGSVVLAYVFRNQDNGIVLL